MNIDSAADLYIRDAGRLRTELTVKTFQQHVGRLQRETGCSTIEAISDEDLRRYCLAGDPAPSTVKTRRSTLKGFFGWCHFMGYCSKNPAGSLEWSVRPGNGGTSRAATWLSEREAHQLVEAQPTDPVGLRCRVVLLAGLTMGLRAIEMERLRWSQLSADLDRLSVYGKGNKAAVLAVPPQLQELLGTWRQEAPGDTDIVLPTVREAYDVALQGRRQYLLWNRGLRYNGLHGICQKAGQMIDMHLTPHDLRRTFAGILEARGVAVTDIQRALRHSDVGVTSRYLDRNPEKTISVTKGLVLG